MRRPAKFRLLFLIVAIVSYWVTSKVMPDTVPSAISWLDYQSPWFVLGNVIWLKLLAVTSLFFIVIPACYWFFVIKAGEQPVWKIIMIFSLSSLIARYQYPEQIAQYFEFIMYLRYPIIAVLLILELFLMYTIVKSLWNARKLSGDPRIHTNIKYAEKLANLGLSNKEKDKLERENALALAFAYEPTSWYYAIKYFSRNHVKNIANINLLSAYRMHLVFALLALVGVAYLCYWLLFDFSQTLAIVIATFVSYSITMVVANHRASRHHSLYLMDDHLVINDSLWGLLIVDVNKIASLQTIESEQGESAKELDKDQDQLKIGRGDANIRLTFTEPQSFFTGMGMTCDKVESVNLAVDTPEPVILEFNKIRSE
ncbi:hypothetical protein GCM10008107_19260 [Psychrosphaera saromensis]|uniref:Uncharacterized protein n=1 Tax=Psychrosphaera saromensis TaxID=716813 RepID=A0A2S7URR2_9GAMM|nr:hypothetical protein [Psychrosphaera saromensis]PQJ52633.1 hypothetical protein BTO11_02515 [Psychrosphaera saromensis]GHB70055.1 hypothetical protein GCM10008107_19260 [Psychrosphaera saromensis]GLQ13111.1 hypothetical protein GCM10007917_05660 [Psychrosphaera saromensis]